MGKKNGSGAGDGSGGDGSHGRSVRAVKQARLKRSVKKNAKKTGIVGAQRKAMTAGLSLAGKGYGKQRQARF